MQKVQSVSGQRTAVRLSLITISFMETIVSPLLQLEKLFSFFSKRERARGLHRIKFTLPPAARNPFGKIVKFSRRAKTCRDYACLYLSAAE